MIHEPDPTHRAAELRRLAAALDAALLHRAVAHAGPDTWRGSTAEACLTELRRAVARLHQQADVLRHQARLLEQQALSVRART